MIRRATFAYALLLCSCTTEAPRENASIQGFNQPTLPATGSGGQTSTGGGGAAGETSQSPTELLYDCGRAPSVRGTFTKKQLRLAAAACAQWEYCRAHGAADALQSTLDPVSTLGSAEDARSKYADLAKTWGEVELFQFGPLPLSMVSVTAGYDPYEGKDLRPRIYSWPQVARCKTEEQLALEKYKSSLDSIVINGRGLHALDYLLFYGGSDSACATGTPTVATFQTIGPSGIASRKLAYAKLLASDLTNRTAALVEAWSPEKGNFEATWVSASGYPSEQEAMNVLAWSLLYLERQVKDWKLGIPAGVTLVSPVTEFEAPYSGLSRSLLEANLRGFRRLYAGCSADSDLGFDDWLIAAGHTELANGIATALPKAESALKKLAELPSPTANDYLDAYTAVKGVTNLLKGDLFGSQSPINLELPAGIEGDTD